MSGKKGMKHYPEEFKYQIREKYKQGASQHSLTKKYGVSRYSTENWCGLRPEVEQKAAKEEAAKKQEAAASKPESEADGGWSSKYGGWQATDMGGVQGILPPNGSFFI